MDLYKSLPKPFFVLAPLDDVTDTVFRQIIASLAPPDLFFTEFVNVDGLQSAGRQKLLPKLKFTNNEKPLAIQIWGKNPKNYYDVAKQIAGGSLSGEANGSASHQADTISNFAGIDLNMGCPDKNIVKNGCCAALINDRQLAQKIIAAAKKGANGKLPVSVKTRVGFNQVDLTWIEFLLAQNLDALYIHGRTRAEMSKVPNNWELIGQVVKLRDKIAPNTLIIGNGDVINRTHGAQLAKKYNLDGVMIGRGVFSDPFAFSDSSPWPSWPKQQKIELYKKHVQLFATTWQNDERNVVMLNKFCKIYINGFDGAKELRENLMSAKTTDDLTLMLAGKEYN